MIGNWSVQAPSEKQLKKKGNKSPGQCYSLLQSFTQTTVSFFKESSLHGVKNVINDFQEILASSNKQQKFMSLLSLLIWVTACILGIVFAVILIMLVYERFQSTPTITTVETNNFPIWNVQFPAVTICNNNKVFKPATASITTKLLAAGLSAETIARFLKELAKLVIPIPVSDNFEETHDILRRLNYTMEKLMFELMQPCELMMQSCSWLGKARPCSELFHVATSGEGFCCSFNYKPQLNSKTVDTKNDFVDETPSQPTYRVSGAGQNVGLDTLIWVAKEEYFSYSRSYYGVSVLVHGAERFPQALDKTTFGQPGCDLNIAVVPSVVVSESSIRTVPMQQRNCYFNDEKSLRSTYKYTFQACVSECAADNVVNVCKCVPFFYPEIHMPTYPQHDNQCELKDVNCLYSNRHIFNSLQPPDLNETVGMNCGYCQPSCSEETFTVQTTISRRFKTDDLTSTVYNNVDFSNYVSLKVYFKDISCIKYRRDVFMTWDALFASFGGIFGLCLGGSVISLVEFLYYFTFKFAQNHGARRQQSVNGSQISMKPAKPKPIGNGGNNKSNPRVIEISVSDAFYANYEKKHGYYLN